MCFTCALLHHKVGKMSSLTRLASGTSVSSSTSCKKTKRQVTAATFKKWQVEQLWLWCDADKDNWELADAAGSTRKALREWRACAVWHNWRLELPFLALPAVRWWAGELVQRVNNCVQATYIYHATSEQHRAVIICVPMEAAKAAKWLIMTYLPIVYSGWVSQRTSQEKVSHLLHMSWWRRDTMAFCKYPALHELEV